VVDECFDHEQLRTIIHFHNKAIVVVTHIENQQLLVLIGIREMMPNVTEVPPDNFPRSLVPPH